jgi:hypothetical protein
MTADIYERVAPYLTVYSTGGVVNPAVAPVSLAGIIQQTSLDSQRPAQGIAYSIRAEAEGSNGAVFVREAVVQLLLASPSPFEILDWRQGTPTNGPRPARGR